VTIAATLKAPVQVTRLDVPLACILALSPAERYAYYMLGHLFNELMFMQKLLHYALPKHEDDRLVRRLPEFGQLFMIARIVVGKLWEAKLTLEKRELADVLDKSFTPLMPHAQDRFTPWKRRLASAKWPQRLRDRHSFHYPTFEQWKNLISPDASWEDDRIYMASQSGNVFYAGSDAIASHWMFGQKEPSDPKKAVDPMVTELISLLGEFTSAVEDTLGAFVAERLAGQQVAPSIDEGIVETELFEHVSIPFWTNMPSRGEAPAV
jgi:hypothetical protein